MKIYFIGTGHGVPTHDRRCSCTMVDVSGALYFIDMGTPVFGDVFRIGKSIDDIRMIAVTHPHGDHCNGIVELLHLANWYWPDSHQRYLIPNSKLIENMKSWPKAFSFAKDYDIGLVKEGFIYGDENIRLTAYPNQHCSDSYSYLFEAEGKSVLFTGDLRHPSVDMPAVIFERQIDLVICETTHFPAHDAAEVFDKAKPRRVIHNHIAPVRSEDLIEVCAKDHGFPYEIAYDGLEIDL